MQNEVATGVGWFLIEHIYAEMQVLSFQMEQMKSGGGRWASRYADYILEAPWKM